MPRTRSVRARPAAAAAIPGAARGETDRALAELYADYVGALLRYATHLTGGDVHSAEDVVQETMLRACQRPGLWSGSPGRAAPDQIDVAITRWDLAAAMAGLRPRDRCLLTAYYLHDDSITKIASECRDRRASQPSVRAER